MVVSLTSSKVGSGLGDEFRPPEGGVPGGSLVDGKLQAVRLARDTGVVV